MHPSSLIRKIQRKITLFVLMAFLKSASELRLGNSHSRELIFSLYNEIELLINCTEIMSKWIN